MGRCCTQNIIQRHAKLVTNPDVVPLDARDGKKIEELKPLLKNGVDILVGTLAKLQELSEEGLLKLFSCRIFVVNDAHLSFKGANAELIKTFQSKQPKTLWGNRRQTIVCSNTLCTPEMEEIAKELMFFPTWIDTNGKDPLPGTAFHAVVRINPEQDLSWKNLEHHIITDGVHSVDDFDDEKHSKEELSEAVKILRGEYVVRAIDAHNMDKGVIICRTCVDCDHLEEYLKHLDEEKYSCASYVPNKKETRSEDVILERFMNNEFKFLICTPEDFERMTITGLPFMINTSLPMPMEKHMYLRRVEKIGSHDRMGLVINFVATVQEKSLKHLENQFDIEFYEIEPDMKVPFIEIDGKKYYGDDEQRPDNIYDYHTAEVADAYKELTQLESQIQLLYLERHLRNKTFTTPVLPSPVPVTTNKRTSGAARRKMMRAKRELAERGGVGGDEASSTSTSKESANKRFRSNDDVTISSAPDKGQQTGQAAVPKGIRVAIAHPDYPTSQFSNDQLVTLQRSIIKAVELVPDDGPQVRFQECAQKSGWLLIVCADQESNSWLRNTVKDLVPWEGAQFKVIQEKYLMPRTFLFEAVIPDDVGVPLTSEEVLTRLRKMNRTLETDKWTVLNQEQSDGGQKWTFRVNLASKKALESMDNRPYFGFGQVHFKHKLPFDNPIPKDGLVKAETVEEPMEVGDEMSAVEQSEGDISVTEPLENSTAASKPMTRDTSVTKITVNGSSTAGPLQNCPSAAVQSGIGNDTSVSEPVEKDTSFAGPMEDDASVTKSTNIDGADGKNSEAVLSEATYLEAWISGTETSDVWN